MRGAWSYCGLCCIDVLCPSTAITCLPGKLVLRPAAAMHELARWTWMHIVPS